jgi:hypothetical protein
VFCCLLNRQWLVTASDRLTLKLDEFFDGQSKPHLHGSYDRHSICGKAKLPAYMLITFELGNSWMIPRELGD